MKVLHFKSPLDFFKSLHGENNPKFADKVFGFLNTQETMNILNKQNVSTANGNDWARPHQVMSDADLLEYRTFKDMSGKLANDGLVIFYPIAGLVPGSGLQYNPLNTPLMNVSTLDVSRQYGGEGTRLSSRPRQLYLTTIAANTNAGVKNTLGGFTATVGINPRFLNTDDENFLNTEGVRDYNKALESLGLKNWSPTRDTETFKRYYKYTPSKPEVTFLFSKIDIAQENRTAGGLNPTKRFVPYVGNNGTTLRNDYNGKEDTVVGDAVLSDKSRSFVFRKKVVIIPRLTDAEPEINASLIYKSIFERRLSNYAPYKTDLRNGNKTNHKMFTYELDNTITGTK